MSAREELIEALVPRTHFQPMAKPQEGSRKRVAQEENEPAMGNMTANSPKAWHVQYNMAPTMENASSRDAGPPAASALPDATNSPVPIPNRKKEGSSQISCNNSLCGYLALCSQLVIYEAYLLNLR
jgi:hypothetical protein